MSFPFSRFAGGIVCLASLLNAASVEAQCKGGSKGGGGGGGQAGARKPPGGSGRMISTTGTTMQQGLRNNPQLQQGLQQKMALQQNLARQQWTPDNLLTLAKQQSETTLQNALKRSPNATVRWAASVELNRRSGTTVASAAK